jgi:hypothetical protein
MPNIRSYTNDTSRPGDFKAMLLAEWVGFPPFAVDAGVHLDDFPVFRK